MKKILLVLIMVLGLAVMTGCGGEKYPEISNRTNFILPPKKANILILLLIKKYMKN